MRPELESIIELAIKDPDQWVSLTAEFLKYFPSKGEFNLNIIENSGMFHGMRNDIKKHLKRLADRSSDLQFVPYEAEFMNKKAFTATFGNVPPPVKHFTLKQKPKSATLRADALAKGMTPYSSAYFRWSNLGFSDFAGAYYRLYSGTWAKTECTMAFFVGNFRS